MVRKKKKRVNFLKNLSAEDLFNALDTFSPDLINSQPKTERELLDLYLRFTDPIVTHARVMSDDTIFVLGNETRALLGHLADYNQTPDNRKNLSDAYGHFRRLNLDTFKIICDELDQYLLNYLESHYHYDYRSVNKKFLSDYVAKYFVSQNAYLDAQTTERTGSNRCSNNIIEKYHAAAKAYADLFLYLKNNKSGIEFVKWKEIVTIAIETVILILGVIQSFIPIIPS